MIEEKTYGSVLKDAVVRGEKPMNWYKAILIGTAFVMSFVGLSAPLQGQEAAQEATETAAAADGQAAPAEPAVPSVAEPTPEGVFPSLTHKGDITEFLKLLSKATQKNIIPSQQVRGQVEVNMFDVTFKEALDAVLLANGYAYVEKGPFIFVYTQKEFVAMQEAARHMEVQVYQLSYIPTQDVAALIQPLISKSGKVTTSPEAGEAKGLSGENWAGDNYIIVQDYPENLEQIASLIETIDKRPPQVLIEATILTASLDDTNQMGIDLFYAGGVNFEFVNSGADLAVTSDAGTDSGMRTDFAGNVNTGGLSIGITSNNVGILVRALESVTDVVTTFVHRVFVLSMLCFSRELYNSFQMYVYALGTTYAEHTTHEAPYTVPIVRNTRAITIPTMRSSG